MKRKKRHPKPRSAVQSDFFASVRQVISFPPEFRIEAPQIIATGDLDSASERPKKDPSFENDAAPPVRTLAELATTLWYLKTKFFKREWINEDSSDDDPRVRKALGRLCKGIDALKAAGIEIDDPTNKRYPQGGANLMKPVELLPTEGLTYEKVTDTVTPIVYFNGQLVQAAEVFVAVPQEQPIRSGASADDGKAKEPVTTPSQVEDPPLAKGTEPSSMTATSTSGPKVPPGELPNKSESGSSSPFAQTISPLTNESTEAQEDIANPNNTKGI